jgi:hypothetical protein
MKMMTGMVMMTMTMMMTSLAGSVSVQNPLVLRRNRSRLVVDHQVHVRPHLLHHGAGHLAVPPVRLRGKQVHHLVLLAPRKGRLHLHLKPLVWLELQSRPISMKSQRSQPLVLILEK